MQKKFDLIVVGSGAAGLITSIISAQKGKSILLVEKLSKIGMKLKATGGGKCNVTNTLDNDTFMNSFGRNGKFMSKAIENFDSKDLIEFLKGIGVDTHSPDGFRIFPTTHNSETILGALENRLKELNITVLLDTEVTDLIVEDNKINGIVTQEENYYSDNVLLATGGVGYPKLGTTGDGFNMVSKLGHKVTDLHEAMIPLHTKENWTANCTADTIANATIKIDIKKHSKLKATGDLIFTKTGIRGPVVLDFAREITPLLKKYGEVPLLINLTKGKNEDEIINILKNSHQQNPQDTILKHIEKLLPTSVAIEILNLCDINSNLTYNKIDGSKKQTLFKTLSLTPLTINGHDGFDKAMITRGGVSLKQINPNTMESKLIDGLYFAGEIVDLDGPCGGYNLQWSFSSGYLVALQI